MQVAFLQPRLLSYWRGYTSISINVLFTLWLCFAADIVSAECAIAQISTKAHEFRTDYLVDNA